MHKSLPPLSRYSFAAPPHSELISRASPVNDSTSAYSDRPSPHTAHSSRSASWLYCSGTSRMYRSPLSAPRRISSMIAALLPVPAVP